MCIAPAGSGKTTTLVARAAWLIATGTPPDAIRAITFNKRAAVEMTERLDAAVGAARRRSPERSASGRSTRSGARSCATPASRSSRSPIAPAVLAAVAPWADEADLAPARHRRSRGSRSSSASRPADVAADAGAGPVARAFVAYEAAVAASGGLDFDDLILRAIAELERDAGLLARWRGRCRELLVDEVQDVDRAQLRLALLLAAPANRIFLVGDDDQSIYGWRLADVRRILGLEALLPGLRRVDLEVNYRCPRQVVERAVRLVEHNGERFAKAIRAGPAASGRLVLAPDPSDETVRLERAIRTWPDDGSTRAILARTNRELLPGGRRRAPARPAVPGAADRAAARLAAGRRAARASRPTSATDGEPLLIALGRVRGRVRRRPRRPPTVATALLGWAVGHADLAAFASADRRDARRASPTCAATTRR